MFLLPRDLQTIKIYAIFKHLYHALKMVDYNFRLIALVAYWLGQRYQDMMILKSQARISLWDVGAGPSDETV
jgi:hypothetical protein